MSYYYNVMEDINKYPDCWAYIIWGGRNTGKTYGGLKATQTENIRFVYVKRTAEDVKLICSGNSFSKKSCNNVDLSPFKSINRDMRWNIRAYQVQNGLGAFFRCDEENAPVGDPVGYIIALSAVGKFKGFDMSDCDWLIFDEFVPKNYDRVMRGEGEQILDLYKTVARDREHRNLPPLKLIAFANPDNASCALTNVLEITDDIVKLSQRKEAVMYLKERGIFMHRLIDNKAFQQKEEQSFIYKAMKDTAWGKMALGCEFSFNDFTQIKKSGLKGYRPICKFKYKHTVSFVYENAEINNYCVCNSQTNHNIPEYDLSRESDQKRFLIDIAIPLKRAHIENACVFENYTQYDLILNYTKYFKC